MNSYARALFWGLWIAGSAIFVASAGAVDVIGPPRTDAHIRPLVFSTEPAPGQPAGRTYGSVGAPVLNNSGGFAFQAALRGPGVGTNSLTWWNSTPEGIQSLMVEAAQVPGAPAGVVWSDATGRLVLNDAGQVLIHGVVRGPGITSANDDGFWLATSSGLVELAREGGPAADGQGVLRYLQQEPVLGKDGTVAFAAAINPPPGVGSGSMWLGPPDGLTRVVFAGDPVPESGPDVVISGFDVRTPVMNDFGEIAFRSVLSGEGIGGNSASLLFRDSSGLHLLAQGGHTVQIGSREVMFAYSQNLLTVEISNYGVAFAADVLITDSTGGIGGSAVLKGRPGNLRLVAATKDPAPGVPAGITFGDLEHAEPLINARGDVFFHGQLTGPGINSNTNGMGLWLEKDGALELIARMGDPAPGLDSANVFNRFEQLSLNANGQVAVFASLLAGPYAGHRGLWATDPMGELQLIALEGVPFDIGGGEMKMPMGFSIARGSDGTNGGPMSFNAAGELAFSLRFDDFTSGMFVASWPVPEPPIGALAVLLAPIWFVWGRRRS